MKKSLLLIYLFCSITSIIAQARKAPKSALWGIFIPWKTPLSMILLSTMSWFTYLRPTQRKQGL